MVDDIFGYVESLMRDCRTSGFGPHGYDYNTGEQLVAVSKVLAEIYDLLDKRLGASNSSNIELDDYIRKDELQDKVSVCILKDWKSKPKKELKEHKDFMKQMTGNEVIFMDPEDIP